MPLQVKDKPFTDARREHFEDLRKNHVPRFLFRAWSASSGGGPSISTNTPTEIKPAAFVSNTAHKFYTMSEYYVQRMAAAHYSGGHDPVTEFSSWTASLHLALCLAESRACVKEKDVHVAVMDTLDLEEEVLVWHVPQLLDLHGYHEYLAHGHIRGRGYKAVKLSVLKKHGICKIYPQLWRAYRDNFGLKLRMDLFNASPGKMVVRDVRQRELKYVKGIAELYGHLALPVAAALICFYPRPWNQVQGEAGKRPDEQLLEEMFVGLGEPEVCFDAQNEAWLTADMVNTTDFPDVRQWIVLLRALGKYSIGRVPPVKIEDQVISKPPRWIWGWRRVGKGKKKIEDLKGQPLRLSFR